MTRTQIEAAKWLIYKLGPDCLGRGIPQVVFLDIDENAVAGFPGQERGREVLARVDHCGNATNESLVLETTAADYFIDAETGFWLRVTAVDHDRVDYVDENGTPGRFSKKTFAEMRENGFRQSSKPPYPTRFVYGGYSYVIGTEPMFEPEWYRQRTLGYLGQGGQGFRIEFPGLPSFISTNVEKSPMPTDEPDTVKSFDKVSNAGMAQEWERRTGRRAA